MNITARAASVPMSTLHGFKPSSELTQSMSWIQGQSAHVGGAARCRGSEVDLRNPHKAPKGCALGIVTCCWRGCGGMFGGWWGYPCTTNNVHSETEQRVSEMDVFI